MNNKSPKQLARAVYRLVARYDAKKPNPDAGLILARIERVVASQQPLRFISFTCSTIRSEYLFSSTPWRYVSLDVTGNNLTTDLPKFQTIYDALLKIYPPTKLTIVIGNTDPYYIYSRQFALYRPIGKKFLMEKFNERWRRYRRNLERWIRTNFTFKNLEVISWYEFERMRGRHYGMSFERTFNRVKKNLSSYFDPEDLEWELRNLKTQFGPEGYFRKLAAPSEALLRQWVRRKFAEYAVQGLWLWESFPNAILVQNEKPSDLRSKMYQPLIRETYRDVLPNVYFFGVDNQGFG